MTSVGLVLGAGGIIGGAYHAGALAALSEAGFDARLADLIVGTSAGSIVAAALRAGLAPADLFARSTSTSPSAEGARLLGDHPPAEFPPRPPFPRGLPLPASPALAATALLPPWNARPLAALAGLLPAGSVPTAPIGDRIRSLYDDRRWPEDPLWVCALRLRDGCRVVLGRDEVEVEDVGVAVQASSAIAGYMQPVRIGDETYVDGGTHSPTNADLVAGLGLDLVVVVSPMSAPWTALRPAPSIGSRALASWVLEREVRAIRAAGTGVLVLEPTAEDLSVMGGNSMDPGRREVVAQQARSTAAQRLEHPAAAELVAALAACVP